MALLKNGFKIAVDLTEALGVMLCAVVAYPAATLLRSPNKGLIYLKFLIPKATFGLYLQARFRRMIGQSQSALLTYNYILKTFEEDYERIEIMSNPDLKAFLHSLYQEYFEIFIANGDFNQGANVIIRAYNFTGSDNLPALSDFNVQVAQILKAGLAASKILGDESVSSLFESGKSIVIRSGTPEAEFFKARSAKTPANIGPEGKILPFKRPSPAPNPSELN